MSRNYVSRYIDIKKCDVIRKNEICVSCGFELEALHKVNSDKNQVAEHVRCKKCGKIRVKKMHYLH